MNPKILIFGCGALGSVFGGFLQKQGENVSYIGLGEHFNTIIKNGIQITGIWGSFHITPINYYLDFSKVVERFDIILLCVKSTATKIAAKQATGLLNKKGIIISIQNGLNNVEIIADYAGKPKTVGGRIIFGAEISKPGTVNISVYADKVLFGFPFEEYPEVDKMKLLEHLANSLNNSKIPTNIVSNVEIVSNIWGKVLYNSALNPLGALLEVIYGDLGKNENTRDILRELIREIFLVIEAKKIKVPYSNFEEYYSYLIEKQLPATANHHSSMYQDIMNGRITEIASLNGAIVEYAKNLGINTPYNELITKLVMFKQRQKMDEI